MSSSHGGIGSTLTGGIQDIAAILPLLGTEQCSDQVSSALTRGYLYAAATPMSIFGSLGMVTAELKTLVSCFSLGGIEGAKILGNMGFEPEGENLSLIMVEAGKGKNIGRYIIETRMEELIKEFSIDKSRITGVSHKSAAWNVKMVATTALLCTLSIAPYIHLNLGANELNKSTTWVFPVLRATGGFITATFIQLLLQRRITTLSNEYLEYLKLVNRDQLPEPNTDIEAAVEPSDTRKRQMDARTWVMLCLLFIGLAASIVGYVGCFSVVQNSTSTFGPVSWLCLEAGLSIMRLGIWAWNPTSDDAPPLEITLELDEYKPLPTCNKDDEEIFENKVLPLTRARDFLKTITSFAGLIEPFINPDLSLYYTLTRKRQSKESVPENGPENAEKHKLGERTLYITVFDHKERTTRVYTRDNEVDTFYSTKSDAPLVDVGHFLLEVEIDAKIDPKGDPVSSDSNNLDSLREHHRSILNHIQYRLGATDTTKSYIIENRWTMKAEDTISMLQRVREQNGDIWKMIVENGKEEERNEESLLIRDYFMHASIESERRLLDEKRVKWIARRMEIIIKETKERFQGEMGVEYRVNNQAVEKPATKSPEWIEERLSFEQSLMELLLLYEMKAWEQLFWIKFKAFLDKIGNNRAEEKERLTREWRANSWKRLNLQVHAAQKRLADHTMIDWFLEDLGNWWASSISQLIEGVEIPDPTSLSEFLNRFEGLPLQYEAFLRIENEIEDTKFRLKRGSELGRFDQFWDDDALFECRYSRSKWLSLSPILLTAPLEIYSHALEQNKNIMHISFGPRGYGHHPDASWFKFQATICDLPQVTSISWDWLDCPSTIHRYPLFINSTWASDLITFAKEIRLKLDPISTYIFTDTRDRSDMYEDKLADNASVLISFVAPTSDECLILRLKHSGKRDWPIEVTLGSTTIQFNLSSKSSLTIDDIILYPNPGPSESDHLSFEPGMRNDIVIQFRGVGMWHQHLLHDLELLDEDDRPWRIREI